MATPKPTPKPGNPTSNSYMGTMPKKYSKDYKSPAEVKTSAMKRTEAKRRALKAVRDMTETAKMRKDPANYDQKGRYGFDGSQGIDPKSPRG